MTSDLPAGDGARSRSDQLAFALDLMLSNPARASDLLLGLSVEAAGSEPAIAAQACYSRARLKLRHGDLVEAEELIGQAQQLWRVAGRELDALRTDLGRMNVLCDLGRHAEAADIGSSLAAAVSELEPTSEDGKVTATWLAAAAHSNRGAALGFMGRNHEALAAYEESLGLAEGLGAAEETAAANANRAVELIALGRCREAEQTLTAAETAYRSLGDAIEAAKCRAHRCRARVLLGEFEGVLEELSVVLSDLVAAEASPEVLRTQLVIADTYASLNLVSEALANYQQVQLGCESTGLAHDLAHAHFGQARLLSFDHQAAARDAFAASEAAYLAAGDRAMAARCRLERSLISDGDEAYALAEQALNDFVTLRRPVEEVLANIRLAEVTESLTEKGERLAVASDTTAELGVPDLSWRVSLGLAATAEAAGAITEARSYALDAVAIVEQLRDSVLVDTARLPFLHRRQGAFELAIRLALTQNDITAAFSLVDKLRAWTLADRLTQRVGAASAPHNERGELDAIYERMLTAPASEVKLLTARARLIETAADRRVTRPPSVAPEQALTVAGSAGTVVTYHTIGQRLIAFISSQDETRAHELVISSRQLDNLRLRFATQISRAGTELGSRHRAKFTQTSLKLLQEISRALLSPLELPADLGSVVLVPDQSTSWVPFAALHDGSSYLIERCEVSYAPSQTVADALTSPRESTEPLLVLAVPDAATPYVETEAEAVRSAVDRSTIYIGASARSTLLHNLDDVGRIIHLACHGIHRDDNPWFSALRLGDGWMTAAEAATLDFGGRIVVLSACESGRQTSTGAEMLGLPWAFLAAGASQVVVNLWRVNDGAAAQLMTSLHRELGTMSTPAALRTAQITLLHDEPHPYFWAPTVVIGSSEPRLTN